MALEVITYSIGNMDADALVYLDGTTSVKKEAEKLFVDKNQIGSIRYVMHISAKEGDVKEYSKSVSNCCKKAVSYVKLHRCNSVNFVLNLSNNEVIENTAWLLSEIACDQEMRIGLQFPEDKNERFYGSVKDDIVAYLKQEDMEEEAAECVEAAPSEMPVMPMAEMSYKAMPASGKSLSGFRKKKDLEELLENNEETFQQMLLRLIKDSGRSNADVYHKANIDKKLFSKIKNNKEYQPSKKTVFSFGLSLGLNVDQMTDFLEKAGYAFAPGSKFDKVLKYCFEHEIYDIIMIEILLDDLGLPLLSSYA